MAAVPRSATDVPVPAATAPTATRSPRISRVARSADVSREVPGSVIPGVWQPRWTRRPWAREGGRPHRPPTRQTRPPGPLGSRHVPAAAVTLVAGAAPAPHPLPPRPEPGARPAAARGRAGQRTRVGPARAGLRRAGRLGA